MVAASAEVAGSAAGEPDAAAGAPDLAMAAAAAGPTAELAGGTCNCKSSADYTWVGEFAGSATGQFRCADFELILNAGNRGTDRASRPRGWTQSDRWIRLTETPDRQWTT
jgi:hypothetical protein